MHHDQSLKKSELAEIESEFNMRTTTAKWCTDNPSLWQDRLWDIMENNVSAIYNMLRYVKSLPTIAHMVRLGSEVLPLYTHKDFKDFYQRADVQRYLETHLADVRNYAGDVRLSFHPAQFVVLASESPDKVDASIAEFEYHTHLAKLMGYGRKFQDFKINVHLSGKGGESVFRKTHKRLSVAARRMITIENDEFVAGLDDVLSISDIVPIVLDIHHHWIRTASYIKPTDSEFNKVVESWRGVRPTIHYAYSRSEILLKAGHKETGKRLPNMADLKANKTELRQHSDRFPNRTANLWALSFLEQADIMCECKHKNIASKELIELYKRIRN